MAYGKKVQFDAIREDAFGDIGASYAAVGAALAVNPRIIRIVNGTNAEVYISFDGVTNHIRLSGNSFVLYDFAANKVKDDGFFLAAGDVIYAKRVSGAPTSGTLSIEVVYGLGGY